jgi:pimeloyl-ACP methyl ester carboxylesterase
MASFVLVHGAWHGGWCWDKLVRALSAAGHEALAPDLPGHGADTTPHENLDLQAYTDRICDVVDSVTGDVVLVGHSLGGITISQVAEHRPDRVRCLVYLAAFIPSRGTNAAENVAEDTDMASAGIRAATSVSDDGHSICFDPDSVRAVFYGDCSDEDVARAKRKICPQPRGVFSSAAELSDDGFGQVPRDYIVCLQDQAVLADSQRSLAERHDCRNVYTMDRSHSPFFSAPEELAKILGEIADG